MSRQAYFLQVQEIKAELAEVTAQREHVTRGTVHRQRLTGGEMLFIHRHQRTVVLLTDQ